MEHLNIKDKKVNLFTCQKKKSFEIIKEKGKFLNRKLYIENSFGDISDIFIRSYDWFVLEAEKLVKRPKEAEYHIWCSTNAENCMKPIEDELVYILEVPINSVIFFDSLKWDLVLNRRYIPKDELDYRKYKENLLKKGIRNEYDIFDDSIGGLNLMERQRVIDSWIRVFDIDNTPIHLIQANIWEIREEWIRDIVYFGEKIPEMYFK